MSLYSIGLISFVIIAQLAPSFFIGLYWNRGSSKAAITGIIVGFLITIYTLILPFTIEGFTGSSHFTENGIFNLSYTRPYALFGIDFLEPPAHAFLWSLTANTVIYLVLSLIFKGNYRERNYAEMYVDSKSYTTLQDGALVWKGEAYVVDIKNILIRFLGNERAQRALNIFFTKYKLPQNTQLADARLINFSEKLLTGSIGSASAKILIHNVVKEEEISLVEVLKILEESKETIANNKLLKEKSDELFTLTDQLKEANKSLIKKDLQKDEFLDTVAHELKTPITGIRATTELILDDKGMESVIKTQFLKNILEDSDRLTRLIHNILDFEKLSKGRDYLDLRKNYIYKTIEKAINSTEQIAHKKAIKIIFYEHEINAFIYDEDRILQVLNNLLSNAIKFCPPQNGIIKISFKQKNRYNNIYVEDNGKGIIEEDKAYILINFINQSIKIP